MTHNEPPAPDLVTSMMTSKERRNMSAKAVNSQKCVQSVYIRSFNSRNKIRYKLFQVCTAVLLRMQGVLGWDMPCRWAKGSRRFERSLCLANVESYSSKYTAPQSTIPAHLKFQ